MSKLLFWAGIILAALIVMRLLGRYSAARQRRARATPRRPVPKRMQAMVRCAHCGVHLPSSEAVHLDARTWCSRDHARAGARPLD